MLLRDLIEIPEHIYTNDFVIKLTEGIDHPQETLDQYVVTEQLKNQFQRALSIIKNSLDSGKSQAAFLHGSFGSGKSHFMAVLNLLLKGNTQAWGHPQLSSVTINYAPLREKKLLQLAFHMIGASSMESAIFGGYTAEIAKLHPGSPVAPLYRGEDLFINASKLMETMGEQTFLEKLFADDAPKSGLARRASAQSGSGLPLRQRYDEAIASAPGTPQRNQLISALLTHFFSSYTGVQSDSGESYLPFDQGLQVMSQHAHSLGYDGIILFLDELILWLANMSSDVKFVHGEIQKLVKLVESQNSDRPAPIISIVARQRDLKDLIGESLSGFEQFNFHDQIKHFEKRFDTINLEDTNLPEIIAQRILKPKTPQAREELREHFDRLKLKDHVRDILAHSYSLDDCRKVYPFSPALIETLVAVSSLLQRNRTAIRILMELLSNNRDSLTVGQLIPVGDLFDLVSGNYEPYDDSVRRGFESAKRLLNERFPACIQDSEGKPLLTADTDKRLFKTVLLAALVPQVPSLRQLTAKKLAALNHGTLKAPIPGAEAATVSKKLGQWSTHIGELQVDPDTNEISLNLTQVDLEKILEGARPQDGPGNRKGTLRRLLFEMLKLDQNAQSTFSNVYKLLWRGSYREFEVLYLNVREKSDVRDFKAGELPRIILDYPFDEEGHHPSDDLNKLEIYRKECEETRTTVWLPHFLSQRSLRQLGRLIMIEYILAGDRLASFLSHLAPTDRPAAEQMLRSQANSLKAHMRIALEMAYGVRPADPGILDPGDQKQLSADKQLQSLHNAFSPRMPAHNLEEAFKEVLAQELEAHYPGSPNFSNEREISLDAVRKVWKEISEACKMEDGRLEVLDKGSRERLREIAQPLGLGKMGETHFVLSKDWCDKFERQMEVHHITGAVRVAKLQEWINQPKHFGLPPRLSSLIIHTFAQQSQRQLIRLGTVLKEFEPELVSEVELRQLELPNSEVWMRAWERVKLLNPELYSMQCSSSNMDLLQRQFQQLFSSNRSAIQKLPVQLRQLTEALQLPLDQSPRLKHARLAAQLRDLCELDGKRNTPAQWIEQLAQAEWSEIPADLAALVRVAPYLSALLTDETLKLIASLVNIDSGQELVDDLRASLKLSESAKPLSPHIELAKQQTLEMLMRQAQVRKSQDLSARNLQSQSVVPSSTIQPNPASQAQVAVAKPVSLPNTKPVEATQVLTTKQSQSPSYRTVSAGQLLNETASEARAELEALLELLQDDSLMVDLKYEIRKSSP